MTATTYSPMWTLKQAGSTIWPLGIGRVGGRLFGKWQHREGLIWSLQCCMRMQNIILHSTDLHITIIKTRKSKAEGAGRIPATFVWLVDTVWLIAEGFEQTKKKKEWMRKALSRKTNSIFWFNGLLRKERSKLKIILKLQSVWFYQGKMDIIINNSF